MSTQTNPAVLRLGARGSLLSRMQSQLVADTLERRHPGLKVELTIIRTSGDRITERPLHEFGGKGLFTKELELALLDGTIDFAVHSFKDVPVTMPLVDQDDLVTAAVPQREDPRDVLVSGKARDISQLPQGATLGTGSFRRQAQALALRPDLKVTAIRGNVDTRLRKLREEEYDAVILAMAGLRRSGLFDDQDMSLIAIDQMIPAAGQGALSLQCRRDDSPTRQLLLALDDPDSALCVRLERQVVQALDGDCHSPIAALATLEGDRLRLRAAVGGRDGRPPVVTASAEAAPADAEKMIDMVIASLRQQGAERLLRGS